MPVTDPEIALVISITGTFESAGDPYVGVAGDYDGMGISCGVLQWNLGSNSLQPLVLAVGEAVVRQTMPRHGERMWRACRAAPELGCAMVREWQTGAALPAAVVDELKALMGSPQMRQAQHRCVAATANRADDLAAGWARDRGQAGRTTQELVWFFDVLTQNGGMRGLGYADVEALVKASGEAGVRAIICDWLGAAAPDWWGREDCLKNAALWREAVPDASFDLLVLSCLRARAATHPRARGVVMNRKGSIAMRRGFVNGALFDFSDRF